MAEAGQGPPRLTVVLAAGQGCEHARAVVDAVRAQLDDGDEFLVGEPDPCDRPGAAPGESHLAIGGMSDDDIHLWGMDAARGDIVIHLEDHGIPGPGFLDLVRRLFLERPALEAQTFWLRNGTSRTLGSRVLFAYVAGLAELGSPRPVPKPVCSSFAMRRSTFRRLRDSGVVQHPGDLEYDVVPRLASAGLSSLPAEGCLTHYQQNTVAEALSAVHWNARAAGAMEQGRPVLGRAPVMVRRYFGHVVHLQRERPRPAQELGLLGACAIAGFTGWWRGRLSGPGAAVDRLKAAHPVAAASPSSPHRAAGRTAAQAGGGVVSVADVSSTAPAQPACPRGRSDRRID